MKNNFQKIDLEHSYIDCILDSSIILKKVALIKDKNISPNNLHKILYLLKSKNYKLIYLNLQKNLNLKKIKFKGKKITTNVSYCLNIKFTKVDELTNNIFDSVDNLCSGELFKLSKECSKYSHLKKDKKIKNKFVYNLYFNWIKDALEKKNNRKILVIKDKEKAKGVIVYTVCKKSFYINLFVVSKKNQNKGFGSKLLNKLISTAQEKNIIEINLITQKNNPASTFYEKLGFLKKDEYNIYHFWL